MAIGSESTEARAKRLRQARERAGYESAAAAAEAMGIPKPTYSAHENGNGGIRTDSAIRYAKKFKVPLEWLLSGKGEPDSVEHEIVEPVSAWREVLGTVQGGVWQEPFEADGVEPTQIPVPADRIVEGARQYFFEVVGDSVNKYVADGGLVFCTDTWDFARDQDDLFRRARGKLVIAERKRADGTFQRTCKQLFVNDQGPALFPASNSTRWENERPIQLNENGDTVEVQIVAVVTDIITAAP